MSTAVAGPGADPKAPQQRPQQKLDALFEAVNRGHGPGLVVGVAQNGRTIYRRGFGLASIEHGVALTPRTRMRLASISKHITCLAALLLAEEGKLDLDAPASAVLPELPTLQGMPTLRQFMTHTSGWRCFQELAYIGSGLAWLPAGAGMAMQLAQTDASFAPGTSQLYCNGGYELLSEAIARASGTSFERFLKDRVFAPLGMQDTESIPSDMAIVPGIATFHQALPDGRWMRGIAPLVDNRGAGAVVSTLDDMLRWMSQLREPDGRVGSAAAWKQLTEVATLHNGLVTSYALGLNRHAYRGVEVIQHGGGLMGVASQMVTVPAHALDIIIMTNGALVNPVQMGWQIVDALLADHLVGEPVPLAGIDRFRHLVGARYHGPSGMLYGFGEVGGLLGLSILNSPPLPVVRDRGEVIGFRMEEAGMGPVEMPLAELAPGPDGGAPAELTISEAGNAQRYRLLPAAPPDTAEAGRALPGRYRCDDLRADASIAFEGEQLVLRIVTPEGRRAAALEAYSDTVFGYTALDPMAPAFHAITLECQGQRITGFRLSSARARRLYFARLPDHKTSGD
jgi:CubicO group peptidase (beta-lactamase class C family)